MRHGAAGAGPWTAAPYVVPLSFGYEVRDGKVVLYFHGAKEGRKHEMIAKNPRVCMEGDLFHGYKDNGRGGVTCDYESFIGYGDCMLVSGEEAEKGIDLLMAPLWLPGSALSAASHGRHGGVPDSVGRACGEAPVSALKGDGLLILREVCAGWAFEAARRRSWFMTVGCF